MVSALVGVIFSIFRYMQPDARRVMSHRVAFCIGVVLSIYYIINLGIMYEHRTLYNFISLSLLTMSSALRSRSRSVVITPTHVLIKFRKIRNSVQRHPMYSCSRQRLCHDLEHSAYLCVQNIKSTSTRACYKFECVMAPKVSATFGVAWAPNVKWRDAITDCHAMRSRSRVVSCAISDLCKLIRKCVRVNTTLDECDHRTGVVVSADDIVKLKGWDLFRAEKSRLGDKFTNFLSCSI